MRISKVIVGGGPADHDARVASAFVSGYQYYGAVWEGDISVDTPPGAWGVALFENAYDKGAQLYIQSTWGFTWYAMGALRFYPTMNIFMPIGYNSLDHIYNPETDGPNCMIGTGYGITANLTAYTTEFYDIDPTSSSGEIAASYPNGFIAGKLAYIANTLDVPLWTARYLARATTGTNYNIIDGYGKIDATAAIAAYDPEFNYTVLDPYPTSLGPVGVMTAERDTSIFNKINTTIEPVDNATSYSIDIIVNSGLYYSLGVSNYTNSFTLTPIIGSGYSFRYNAYRTDPYGNVRTVTSDLTEEIKLGYINKIYFLY